MWTGGRVTSRARVFARLLLGEVDGVDYNSVLACRVI